MSNPPAKLEIIMAGVNGSAVRIQQVEKEFSNTRLRKMEEFVKDLLKKVPGAKVAFVSTMDGLNVFSVQPDGATEDYPAELKASFPVLFSTIMDQGGKLQFGPTKSILTTFETVQLLQVDVWPFVACVLAEKKTPAGLLLAIAPMLSKALQPLREKFSADST